MEDILTLEEVKARFPVEHDDDDDLLTNLIEEAHARLQSHLERQIRSASYTEYFDGGKGKLFLRHWPIAADPAPVVTDTGGTIGAGDDVVLAEADYYRVDPETGIIERTSSIGTPQVWEPGVRRFKVTYTGGLDSDSEWDEVIEPELRSSLRDLVAFWYEQPNPGVTSEEFGPGARRKFVTEDLPPRVRGVWDKYRAW